MTTRHTISHADELYSGNAFLDGYSPDGRRGIQMTHLYVREYGAIATADPDGIMSASAIPSSVYTAMAPLTNWLSITPSSAGAYLCTGALIRSSSICTGIGATLLTLDVPRNIVFMCTAAAKSLIVEGRDEYNQKMVERITTTSVDAYSSGMKAFKYIDKFYTTVNIAAGCCIGTGNRIGLPFHLSGIGKFLGLSVDGYFSASVGSGASAFIVVTGLDLSTVDSTSEDAPDVRGTIRLLDTARVPNSTRTFSALMIVNHTTRNKAFGVAPATALA
jgi:hypothetical protein